MATGSKLDALKAKLSNVSGDDGIQVARKAAMIQMAYDKFSKDPSDEEYDDAMVFLQEASLPILQKSEDIICVLTRAKLQSDEAVALSTVMHDIYDSVNALAIFLASDKASAVDRFFKIPTQRLVQRVRPLLELRGIFLNNGALIPDEVDVTADDCWGGMLKAAGTVKELQNLKWTEVTNMTKGCPATDQKMIEKLYAGVIGPQDNKDFIPSIRQEFLSKGLGLDAAEHFERDGKNSLKDITNDDIKNFENKEGVEKKLSNKVRAAVSADKDKDPQKEAALALAAVKKDADARKEATKALLDKLDVGKSMEEQSQQVKAQIEKLRAEVSTPSDFGTVKLEDPSSLLAGLAGQGMNLTASGNNVVQSFASNEELVVAASGGLALHGICVLVDPNDLTIESSSHQTLGHPDFVQMMSPAKSFESKVFKATSQAVLRRFTKTALSAGMSAAESSTSSKGGSMSVGGAGGSVSVSHETSNNESNTSSSLSDQTKSKDTDENTKEASIVESLYIPMKSFRIPLDAMKPSDDFTRDLVNVDTELRAKRFLRNYGSHVAAGTHTLGGTFNHIITMKTATEVSVTTLFGAAGKKLSDIKGNAKSTEVGVSGSYDGVTVAASVNKSNSVQTGTFSFSTSANNQGENTQNMNAFYEAEVFCHGPNATTPSNCFAALNKTSNWACIDRGDLRQLIPVWTLIDEKLGTEDQVISRARQLLWREWHKTATDIKFQGTSMSEPVRLPLEILDQLDNYKRIGDFFACLCTVIAPADKSTADKSEKYRLNDVKNGLKDVAGTVVGVLKSNTDAHIKKVEDFLQFGDGTRETQRFSIPATADVNQKDKANKIIKDMSQEDWADLVNYIESVEASKIYLPFFDISVSMIQGPIIGDWEILDLANHRLEAGNSLYVVTLEKTENKDFSSVSFFEAAETEKPLVGCSQHYDSDGNNNTHVPCNSMTMPSLNGSIAHISTGTPLMKMYRVPVGTPNLPVFGQKVDIQFESGKRTAFSASQYGKTGGLLCVQAASKGGDGEPGSDQASVFIFESNKDTLPFAGCTACHQTGTYSSPADWGIKTETTYNRPHAVIEKNRDPVQTRVQDGIPSNEWYKGVNVPANSVMLPVPEGAAYEVMVKGGSINGFYVPLTENFTLKKGSHSMVQDMNYIASSDGFVVSRVYKETHNLHLEQQSLQTRGLQGEDIASEKQKSINEIVGEKQSTTLSQDVNRNLRVEMKASIDETKYINLSTVTMPVAKNTQWKGKGDGSLLFYALEQIVPEDVKSVVKESEDEDSKVWPMDGSTWKPNDDNKMYTPNKQYYLVFQNDGNLVMYKEGGVKIWASNDSTEHKYALNTADKLVFQTDGNMVIYDKDGKALWSSDTDCIVGWGAVYKGKSLNLSNEGRLFIIAENKEDPDDVIDFGLPTHIIFRAVVPCTKEKAST